MNDTEKFGSEVHLAMWRHYETLRQAKNSGFLAANTILVAVTGFQFKRPEATTLIVWVSLLGILVCISWFLLLTRNSAYIEYHRALAGEFSRGPQSWTPRSRYLDRTPVAAFLLFWMGVLIVGL